MERATAAPSGKQKALARSALWALALSLTFTAAGFVLFLYTTHAFYFISVLLWPSLLMPENLSLAAQLMYCMTVQFIVLWVLVYAAMLWSAHLRPRSNSTPHTDARDAPEPASDLGARAGERGRQVAQMNVSAPSSLALVVGWVLLLSVAGFVVGAPFGHMAVAFWLPAFYFGLSSGLVHVALMRLLPVQAAHRFLTTVIAASVGALISYIACGIQFSVPLTGFPTDSNSLMLAGIVAAYAAVSPWFVHFGLVRVLFREARAH